MTRPRSRFPSLLLTLLAAPAFAAPIVTPQRVAEIAVLLPEKPAGLGHPITDRAAWAAFGTEADREDLIEQAERLLETPLPAQPDDLFLDFSKTGNRTRWQTVAGLRRGRLRPLVLAECIEGKGRFLPAFHDLSRAVCGERTWVMPAHDRKLENFQGKSVSIDLASSALAWEFATALWLLGDRIEPATRQMIRARIEAFVLNPARDGITGKGRENGWMRATHNWNAVCWSGTTGAALAMVESRNDRALFAAAAEAYTQFFLDGFTPDGYCSEGMGYWNYGFGRYLLLSETLLQATGAKLNLLERPGVREPARFPRNIEIQKGVFPAFADCGVNPRPSPAYMHFISRSFGFGWEQADDYRPAATSGDLFDALIWGFANSAEKHAPAPPNASSALRSWFSQAGILVSRPPPGSSCRLAVALKGGHNAEHHNHNDLGSFVAVAGREALILDPGGEVYTARTFSDKRYDSKLLSSYGHPVPLVAGVQQRPGRIAQARVVETNFTETADRLVLDLASAYAVPDLKKLTRTFTYSRADRGHLVVRDEVALGKSAPFETALITFGSWKKESPSALTIRGRRDALRVEIDAGGQAFDLVAEEIREDVHGKALPTRIAVRLRKPVREAVVSMRIAPLDAASLGPQPFNGGFEQGDAGWDIPANGLGTLTTAHKASGTRSLRITDTSPKLGSNISSDPIPIDKPGRYEIRGKFFCLSGKGLGIYARCTDAYGNSLNQTPNGNHKPVGLLGDATPQAWAPFAFPVDVPPDTDAVVIWIHSISSAQVDGCLDDIEFGPERPDTSPATP